MLLTITSIEAEETLMRASFWVPARMIPGDSLRTYRENFGLTQAELGKRLGNIPRQLISNMEHGTRNISLKMAK